MKNVVITISGKAGSGKTAIAQIIYEALLDRGITVQQYPADIANGNGRDPYQLGVCIGGLQAHGFEVHLHEVHTPREKELS